MSKHKLTIQRWYQPQSFIQIKANVHWGKMGAYNISYAEEDICTLRGGSGKRLESLLLKDYNACAEQWYPTMVGFIALPSIELCTLRETARPKHGLPLSHTHRTKSNNCVATLQAADPRVHKQYRVLPGQL